MTWMTYFLLLYTSDSFARSLKATATKLSSDVTNVGYALAIFGIVVGGIYFILGKQDSATKLTQAVFGAFVLFLAPAIISFIKGVAL